MPWVVKECGRRGAPAASGDPPHRHEVIREPLSTLSVQIVVPDAATARRGVDEPTASRINGNVTDPPVLREEHKVPHRHRAGCRADCRPRASHLPRCTGEIHPLSGIDVLHESRAVEASRSRSSIHVRSSDVLLGVRNYSARRCGRARVAGWPVRSRRAAVSIRACRPRRGRAGSASGIVAVCAPRSEVEGDANAVLRPRNEISRRHRAAAEAIA